MKIISVSYNYSPGFLSPDSWFKRTAIYTGVLEALAKSNTVISVKQIGWQGHIEHNGVEHHFTHFGSNKFIFVYRLNRFIQSLKPDVVLLQGLHYPVAFICLRAFLNKRTVIIAQHHAEKPSVSLKRYAQKMADGFIDAYLFASRDMGHMWIDQGIINRVNKIHEVMEVSSLFYPIEKPLALEKTGINGTPIFLWVGRLNENKDPLNVVNAFLRFAGEQPNAKLYMIYQTEELLTQINVLLNNHPNKEAVVLIGKVENTELLYWYNSADFLISGSHYEGSGTAVCEAMSCGCIPVITDIPSFRMITNNGDCGILYQAGNEDNLVGALRKTQTFPLEQCRQKGLDWFEKKLSFNAIARDIETLANSIFK